MKKVFIEILMLCSFFVPLSCTRFQSDSGVYKVRIPLSGSDGQYSLQTVELHTVRDLPSMAGDVAYMRVGGGQVLEPAGDGSGMWVRDFNQGNTPNGHFVQQGDTYIPADFTTSTLTTAMYHFENIKKMFDQYNANVGISFPRPVLVDFQEELKSGGRRRKLIDNAFFSPDFNLFVLLPYQGQEIPLVMNGGVLAHEFAHNIFYAYALKGGLDYAKIPKMPDSEKHIYENDWSAGAEGDDVSRDIEDLARRSLAALDGQENSRKEIFVGNFLLYRAVDEGLADYWGSLYMHGNTKWLFDSGGIPRSRDPGVEKAYGCTDGEVKAALLTAVEGNYNGQCELEPHQMGAYVSRLMFLTSKEVSPGAAATMILDFIPRFAKLLNGNWDKQLLTLKDVIRLMYSEAPVEKSLKEKVSVLFPNQVTETEFATPKKKKVKSSRETAETDGSERI